MSRTRYCICQMDLDHPVYTIVYMCIHAYMYVSMYACICIYQSCNISVLWYICPLNRIFNIVVNRTTTVVLAAIETIEHKNKNVYQYIRTKCHFSFQSTVREKFQTHRKMINKKKRQRDKKQVKISIFRHLQLSICFKKKSDWYTNYCIRYITLCN